MPTRSTTRLHASPAFLQARSFDGRPYVLRDAEPYEQFWLSERERVLLALFSARGGSTEDDAAAAYFRLTGQAHDAAGRRRVAQAIAGMRRAGVLLAADEDTSRYDRRIVADYVAHRPFPQPIADHLVQCAGIGAGTRVLDLAGGPGDLALALARVSTQVSMMELSHGFAAAARQRARTLGVPLRTLHDSCNRLPHRDDPFDVITVSQALHWLDDVAVCRGVIKLLQPDGSFCVVHSAIALDDTHPLAWLLGHDSVLGAKPRQSFVDELRPLQRRLALLFEALDAPEVQRIDPTQARGGTRQRIGNAGVARFQQRRPFDAGYARGFLTPQHIALTGRSPESVWAEVDARCAQADPDQLLGTHHWGVLHFRRGADATAAADWDSVRALPFP